MDAGGSRLENKPNIKHHKASKTDVYEKNRRKPGSANVVDTSKKMDEIKKINEEEVKNALRKFRAQKWNEGMLRVIYWSEHLDIVND